MGNDIDNGTGKTKKQIAEIFSKINERKSRTSLTLVFAIFAFVMLVIAIGVAAVTVYIFAGVGIIVIDDGRIKLIPVILIMFVVSVVIGAGVAFYTSRFPLKPINEMINKMNRLASGDFKARLKFGRIAASHAAFEEITAAFNKMAEQLDSTELLRHDFINNFSHEFKTPIVSIAGFARLLSKGKLTEEQKNEYLNAIIEESTRLSVMATNVLNLTKVENQTILTDITEYNLSEQIRSAVLLLESKWTGKEIELQLEFDEYTVQANEELLKHVWINLIDNAVKFAPMGGEVSVNIEKDGELISVKVSNTGSEIPKEKLHKIFGKFYQCDESHATQGNGIGLAIVKSVVELHSGEVLVESENGVTSFTVRVPEKQT